jgi:hypothetical protein
VVGKPAWRGAPSVAVSTNSLRRTILVRTTARTVEIPQDVLVRERGQREAAIAFKKALLESGCTADEACLAIELMTKPARHARPRAPEHKPAQTARPASYSVSVYWRLAVRDAKHITKAFVDDMLWFYDFWQRNKQHKRQQ